MFKSRILFCLILFVSAVFSQEKSIHEFQLNQNYIASVFLNQSLDEIIPIKENLGKETSKTVFGYLPDYYLGTYADLIRYDILTHIAAFPFNADSTGDIALPANWPWTEQINEAHNSGVRVLTSVTNYNPGKGFFDQAILTALISDQNVKNKFFENIAQIINDSNLDGVNLDFENIITAEIWNGLVSLVEELRTYLDAEVTHDVEISFASPAVNWGSYNFDAMASVCDYLFIMAYDYHWKTSPVTGPIAPVEGGTYNVYSSLNGSAAIPNTQYENILNTNPDKLVLGLPLYGYEWLTKGEEPGDSTLGAAEVKFYSDINPAIGDAYRWDEESSTPWGLWFQDTVWKQLWFEDERSIGMKIDLAFNNDLSGIGFWSLGLDGGDNSLWQMIEDKIKYVSVDRFAGSPSNFVLYQNYPNPFNPSTRFRFSLPSAGLIKLSIFNLLGETVSNKTLDNLNAGLNEFNFNADGLSAGVYFYRLIFKNKMGYNAAQNGKMILLK